MRLPAAAVAEASIPTPICAIAPGSAEADSLVQNYVLVDINGNTPLLLTDKMSRVHSSLMLLKDSRVDPCGRDHRAHGDPIVIIAFDPEADVRVVRRAQPDDGGAARVFDEMWSYHSVQEFRPERFLEEAKHDAAIGNDFRFLDIPMLISFLVASGGTNIAHGLKKAAIVLLPDGHHVQFHTFSFGSDHDLLLSMLYLIFPVAHFHSLMPKAQSKMDLLSVLVAS
ncbi:unnamed protein product [Miscanthus lutarioriparius]|uniref:Uncharacterized protein n=1 Tax=Miscanthus lutarioriparius TaxID=422564 RepID=A0A811MQ87_9POAL|nr:unnamed protein product [Miscanthus lutarioriparius]